MRSDAASAPGRPVDFHATHEVHDFDHGHFGQHGRGAGSHGAALLPLSGELAVPRDVPELYTMALSRPLEAGDTGPFSLAVVLVHLARRPDAHGLLSIRAAGKELDVDIAHGAPALGRRDREEIRLAFTWKRGTYEFTPDAKRRIDPSRTREPAIVVVARGLRTLLRTFPDDELEAALAPRMADAPTIDEGRAAILPSLGLSSAEFRCLDAYFDRNSSTRDIIHRGGLGHSTALQMLHMLELFEIISWQSVIDRSADALLADVRKRAARAPKQNHFEALDLHWSASADDVDTAFDNVYRKYGPDSRLAKSAPEEASIIVSRAATAHDFLIDDVRRNRYRAEAYPDIDPEAIRTLMEQQSKALAMKGDAAGAHRAVRITKDVDRSARYVKRYIPPAEPAKPGSARPAEPSAATKDELDAIEKAGRENE